jgi:RNA polymerase sigma-70 factor (ECF subfamily)
MASLPTHTQPMTDAQLIVALRNGDEAAFTLLLERYHAGLVQVADSFLHDATAANTAVGDAVRDLLASLASFDGQSRVAVWLFGMVIRHCRARLPLAEWPTEEQNEQLGACIDPARFRGPEEQYPGGWRAFPASWGAISDQRLHTREMLVTVRTGLGALPPAQQRVVLLRDVHECTAPEVSELLGISLTHQHALLNRGRTSLREALASILTGER